MDQITDHKSGHRARLRERFLRTGVAGLHDYEVMELLLMYAIPRRDVKPLAKELLAHFGSLPKVIDATVEELTAFPGIGENAAGLILLLKQVCGQYLEQQIRTVDVLDSASKVINYLKMKLGGSKKEIFMVLFLDSRCQLIGSEQFAGTVDRANVYTREVAEKCLLCRASSVILAHNHPTGVCEPSAEDRLLTHKLKTALSALGISIHDHIIVCTSSYYSMSAHKEL